MQTTSGGIAVVTTTLAQTDRRALSQAWYSALHLAESNPARTAKPPRGATAAASRAPRPSVAGAIRAPRANATAARIVRGSDATRTPEVRTERRLPAGVLGRRIAKLVARPAAPAQSRAATVSVRGARVHVIVRTHGSATRIVALCPPPLEARVARALAQARFALASRGVRVEAGA
jgi:hypothetical protein